MPPECPLLPVLSGLSCVSGAAFDSACALVFRNEAVLRRWLLLRLPQ
jgi:hypothetical protein